MPSGLAALLDDVAVISRMAAASIDDVGAAAAKAGSKAAGVVIDDAAVTPGYVTNFSPARELPIIAAIAKGSLRNKLLILLPIALALSALLPQAITPLLMIGGAYLCFEGAEKLIEKFTGATHGETLDGPIEDPAAFEKARISGAVRTDFILSAEIMAIALSEVADSPLIQQGVVLAIVGIAITVVVYGAVALIVKMDDIGLHLAQKPGAGAQKFGRGLVAAMPIIMTALSNIGTLAMLWVGGQILLHGLHELGLHGPSDVAHAIQHAVEGVSGGLAGVTGWLTYAIVSAIFGMAVGSVIAGIVHWVQSLRGKNAAPAH